MATRKSTAVSRFAPNQNSFKAAELTIEVERLQLLSRVNERQNNLDTPEHIADLYRLIGLNLAVQQLRMGA